MSKRLCLILMGGMGPVPFAGMAWEALHYLEGFRRLGHDVYYVEDNGAWPYDPSEDGNSQNCQSTTEYLARIMRCAGFSESLLYRGPEAEPPVYCLSASRLT